MTLVYLKHHVNRTHVSDRESKWDMLLPPSLPPTLSLPLLSLIDYKLFGVRDCQAASKDLCIMSIFLLSPLISFLLATHRLGRGGPQNSSSRSEHAIEIHGTVPSSQSFCLRLSTDSGACHCISYAWATFSKFSFQSYGLESYYLVADFFVMKPEGHF